MTDELEEEVMAILEEIDHMGGSIKAIENEWIQNEIAKSAYEHQQSVDNKTQKIIGVNTQIDHDDSEPNLQAIDKMAIQRQVKSVKTLKTERDNEKVKIKLDILNKTAKSTDNLMPSIIDCVRAESTLGEVANTLRTVFGEF
jgi:methylmalonyl-CoA mutase N-terminal domain/subunit